MSFYPETDPGILSELIRLAETGNGRPHADNLASVLLQRPDLLPAMVTIVLSNTEPASRRIIWALDLYDESHPGALAPFLGPLSAHLPKAFHDALIRHTLRILTRYPLPDDDPGALISCCFDYLSDPIQPPAIRVYAMEILFSACRTYPELRRELADTIRIRLHEEPAGVQSRGSRILTQLSRLAE